jgi:hypothetical protein
MYLFILLIILTLNCSISRSNASSYLMLMGGENFQQEKIDDYYNQAVEYVCDMYSDTVDAEMELRRLQNTATASSDSEEEKIEEEANTQDVLVDDHMMALYTMMRDNDRINNQDQEPDPNKHRKEFKSKIKRQMDDYKEHCKMMNMEAWLDVYGNKNYLNEKAKNPLELKERINKIKDPGYIAKFFDVLTWWKVEGAIKFKQLSVAANVFLGKPTHNGFQEIVFSRGVYLDGKLKKRLKEDNFEMSVLNSFNNSRVTEIENILKQNDNRQITEWMMDKLTRDNQAKELIQFYKKDDVFKEQAMELDDDSTDVSTVDHGLEDIESDDESLVGYLTSEKFQNDKNDE